MADLLTDHNLIGTDREDIRQLAEAQTLTVLTRLDASQKRSLVRFLHGAGLIKKYEAIVNISGADLRGANLRGFFGLRLEQQANSFKGATMPNGQKYEDWRKDKEGNKNGV